MLKKNIVVITVLLIVLGALTVLNLFTGKAQINPATIVKILLHRLTGHLFLYQSYQPEQQLEKIIWGIYFPRGLMPVLVGGLLALAGLLLQGVFRNPLADPFVIGSASGAALGATLALTWGTGLGLLSYWLLPLCAFTGSLAAVMIVLTVARFGFKSRLIFTILLTGIALNALFSSLVAVIMALHQESVLSIFTWLMGSFNNKPVENFYFLIPIYLVCTICAIIFARALDVLGLGEEQAAALGLPVNRFILLVIVIASLASSAAVAASGILGFIGLVAPHLARLLCGHLHRRLVIPTLLTGGVLTLGADILSRLLDSRMEFPAGIITSLIGAPLFLYFLYRSREVRS